MSLLLILFLGTWTYLAYRWHSSRKQLKACDLVLLRRELGRLLILNRIDQDRYTELVMWIDAMLKELLGHGGGITFWEERRDVAWLSLRARMGMHAKTTPPWKQSGPVMKPAETGISALEPIPEKPKEKESPPVHGVPEVELPDASPTATLETEANVRITEPEPVFGKSGAEALVSEAPEVVLEFELPEEVLTVTFETGAEPIVNEPESTQPTESVILTAPDIVDEQMATPEAGEPGLPEIFPGPFRKIPVGIEKPTCKPVPADKGEQGEAAEFAWKPAEPSALERAMRSVSGWSKIVAPFLAQNILWFIGGFSFITGTIFLVALTEEFVKAMIICGALFTYTMIILGGGYKLRKKRPDLESASGVLIAIGSMLIPLSIWAAADLIDIGLPDPLKTAAGFLIAALNIGTFYVTARVASGLADRSIAGPYPVLFISLASIQMAAPLVSRVTWWTVPAGFHLLLLGLAGYAVKRFVDVWLKSVFLDRRKIAYFFAGTIVFASLVSFVHLTWRFKGVLPNGYAGPFLMAVCGLLFYADSRFKEWTAQYAFLSKFTFAVYGLSILALTIPLGAPSARLVTLVLGAGVYATVLRYYLTLPPLYLLVGCLSGLYYLFFLQHLPLRAWFLAGLPGLAGLVAVYGFAVRRKAAGLGLTGFRCMAIIASGLAVASFIDAEPGWISMFSSLSVTGFLYYILGCAPSGFVSKTGWVFAPNDVSLAKKDFRTPPDLVDLRDSPWLYLVMASCAAALVFAPVIIPGKWAVQFGICLVVFSIALTEAGLWVHGRKKQPGAKETVLLNTALASAVSSLALVFLSGASDPLLNYPLSPVMGLAACVFFRQSLALKVRPFFYVAAVLVGAAGSIAKYTWFPHVSIGTMKILTVLAIWWMLWWIDRKEKKTSEVSYTQSPPENPDRQSAKGPTLLGVIPTCAGTFSSTVRTPLQVFMVVLWAWALFRLVYFIAFYDLKAAWVANAALETLATMLLFGYFRLQRFWSVPVLLGAAALLSLAWKMGITDPAALAFLVVAYAFAVWAVTSWVISRPVALRLADFLNLRTETERGAAIIDTCTHWTAYGITLAGFATVLAQWIDRPLLLPLPALFATVFTGAAFFWLSGQHYRARSHSWPVIGAVILASFFVHTTLLGIESVEYLPVDSQTGLLLAALCMGFWMFARFADSRIVDTEQGRIAFSASLYRKPLRLVGAALGVLGGIQETTLVWIDQACFFGPIATTGLVLAGVGVLLCNLRIRQRALSLVGIFGSCLGLLWIYAILTKSVPFTPDIGLILPDQWIALAFMGLALAFGTRLLSDTPGRWKTHGAPMWIVAALCWLTVFAEACPELARGFLFGTVPSFVSLLFLIQCAAFLALAQSFSNGPGLRGFVVPVLLSAALFGFPGIIGPLFRHTVMAWGFVLWTVANFVLPRFNQRLPKWAIDSTTWPWFGLVSVAVPMLPFDSPFHWHYWLVLSVYLFLFLRNSGWKGFPWMASCFLTVAGIHLLSDLTSGFRVSGCQYFAIACLFWSNLLVRAVPLWRKYGQSVSEKLEWKHPDLAMPFTVWPGFIMTAWLGFLIWESCPIYLKVLGTHPSVAIMILAIASFAHLFSIHRTLVTSHLLILAIFTGALKAWAFVPDALPRLPILVAIWAVVLFAAHVVVNRRKGELTEISKADSGVKSKAFRSLDNEGLKQAIAHWHMVIPWAGFVLTGVPLADNLTIAFQPQFWIVLSVFLFVMMRNNSNVAWPVLAVFALTVSGIAAICRLLDWLGVSSPVLYAVGILGWINLLLRLGPVWSRHGQTVSEALGWKAGGLAWSLYYWPFVAAAIYSVSSFKPVIENLFFSVGFSMMETLPTMLMCAGTAFHLFALKSIRLEDNRGQL